MNYYQKIKIAFIDLLFPIKCIGCGLELEDLEPKKRWICENCLEKVPIRRSQACPVCEEYSEGGKTHIRCKKKTSLDGLWVSSEYSDMLVSEAIKKLKFSFVKDMAFGLFRIIEKSVFGVDEFGDFHDVLLVNFSKADDEEKYTDTDKNLRPDTLLIPIPLHKKRYNWRGFNQAELISNHVSDKFALNVDASSIARKKNTKPQTKVESFAKRKTNMKNAFVCLNAMAIKDKNVIIIDDVSTTLATMDECAKVIKKAGAKSVWGLVVARR